LFCVNEFNALLARHGKTKEEVAAIIGVNPVTLYRKMNGLSDFNRHEIQLIIRAFDLDETTINSIFFASELTATQD